MGLKIERQKPQHLLAAGLSHLLGLALPDKLKFRSFLHLEWIHNRPENEMSERMFDGRADVMQAHGFKFISDGIEYYDSVLDLSVARRVSDNYPVTKVDRKELLNLVRKCDMNVFPSAYFFGIKRYWCEVR